MAIPRSSINLGRTVLRRAATQSRTQAWRQAARRHASTDTASAHKAKKTSDIPWMIGSVAFTVPAAVWLLGQGPEKSDHHGASHEAKEEPKEEESEGQEEEATAEESTEEKSEGDSEEKTEDKSDEKTEDKSEDKSDAKSEDDSSKNEKKDDSSKDEKKESEGDGDDQKSESSEGSDGKETPDTSGDEDEYEKPGPNAPGQINYKSSMKRGPGENQKGGERAKSETSGEKNAAGDKSGAQNPYLDDDEKSKKGEGLKETQRIHGTVRSDRPLR